MGGFEPASGIRHRIYSPAQLSNSGASPGGPGGSRTLTPSRTSDFESGASTNSATGPCRLPVWRRGGGSTNQVVKDRGALVRQRRPQNREAPSGCLPEGASRGFRCYGISRHLRRRKAGTDSTTSGTSCERLLRWRLRSSLPFDGRFGSSQKSRTFFGGGCPIARAG